MELEEKSILGQNLVKPMQCFSQYTFFHELSADPSYFSEVTEIKQPEFLGFQVGVFVTFSVTFRGLRVAGDLVSGPESVGLREKMHWGVPEPSVGAKSGS